MAEIDFIKKLIAAVSPDIYCKPEKRKEVKKIIKEEGYTAAIKKADLVEATDIFDSFVTLEPGLKAPHPLEAPGLDSPLQVHKLIYDSPSEGLEPTYFWILDFMQNGPFKNVDKIVDNFVSAPGSAHFSELGMKATKMQEEAMKTLGTVNTVLKSVLNIIYDLREFKLRLDTYDKYKKSEGPEKGAAMLALKQIWLDSVDIKRGNTAIKAMAQQFDYVTLIDAFMATSTLEQLTNAPGEGGGLDLNERVRRILLQRFADFLKWVEESENELRKRFEIEKKYLKSQVSTLKLYSRWVRPYLEASRKLEQRLSPSAALVTTFNTILLELTLLGQQQYKADDDVYSGDLPEFFKNLETRKYFQLLLVEFKFRGIPQRAGQGFTFGGRTEVTFTGFSLNDQELDVFKKEMEKAEFGDVLGLIEGATQDSLDQIQKDIDEFLEDKKTDEKDKEEEKARYEDDVNPFTSLFNFFSSDKKKKDEKKDDKDKKKEIKPDDQYERVLRSQAILAARDMCKTIFETYKKAHQMPSF